MVSNVYRLPPDTRDADTIMASVESEFRRACKAQRDFLIWYNRKHDAPFTEKMQRYGQMVTESQQWAASYRRISLQFPHLMDRLHALLLPIQAEIDKGE
jgi:hypothetical protein